MATVPDSRQRGQVLIIILLVMIVGLTSGLFLLGRTTTDVSLTTALEESTRAFNAAEAGIEQAIRSTTNITGNPISLAPGLTYQVNVDELRPESANSIYPESKTVATQIGETFTVWLVPHDPNTGKLNESGSAYPNSTMTACFTSVSGGTVPAIGVTAYYKDSSGIYHTSFAGYDPNGARRGQNNFKAAGGSGSCSGYSNSATISLAGDFSVNITSGGITPIALRIEPYYANAYLAVIPAGAPTDFPNQGNKIESLGQAGETSRKIEVSEQFTQPAPFLDQAVFSFGNTDFSK
ncbi:hypothetical protein C4579_02705 [Candidatus Microgenomates bacterium]|nr:MAG: hypothetical protein C4579_02705 [Candidatus Microgenomates bacterium]